MRRWLAKLICPEAFEGGRGAQDRLGYIRRRLDELDQWCGHDFPEIRAAVEWARKSERIHFMSLADYDAEVATARKTEDYAPIMVGGIDRFREEIRARFGRRPEGSA